MSAVAEAEVLPWLPQAWLEGISAGKYQERKRAKSGKTTQKAWIRGRPDSTGEPCSMMQNGLDKTIENRDGAAHDWMVRRTDHLIKYAYEGHRGLSTVLNTIHEHFVKQVHDDRMEARARGEQTGTLRTPDEASREFERAVYGTVDSMIAEAEEAGLKSGGAAGCSCWDEPEDIGWGTGGEALPPHKYEFDEDGTAKQIRDVTNSRLAWVEGDQRWLAYLPATGLWEGERNIAGHEAYRVVRQRIKSDYELQKEHAKELLAASSDDAEMVAERAGRMYKWYKDLGNSAKFNGVLNLAKTHSGIWHGISEWDQGEDLLATGDGKVIVLTDEGVDVRDARPEDRLVKHTPTGYFPDARCPDWESYLKTSIPDEELRWWVQRMFGSALYGANLEQMFVFLHGKTGSGKSTMVEAIGAAVGEHYAGTNDLSLFKSKLEATGRPDILKMISMRFAFASEAGAEWKLHNDELKKLTGGDRVSARANHGNDFIDRVPHFTPFVATNTPPTIIGADAALWRRLFVVPFDHPPARLDRGLTRRLRSQPTSQAAILRWLLDGWAGYCSQGLRDDVPLAVLERTREFKGGVSLEHTWLYESCDFNPEFKESGPALHRDYVAWCTANGINNEKNGLMNNVAFGKFLGRQGFEAKQWKDPETKKKVNGWLGIRLKEGPNIKSQIS